MREDTVLYSESQSRLLVTVHPEHRAAFEELFAGQSCRCIGEVMRDKELLITGLQGEVLVKSNLKDLKEAWQEPLREL